MPFEEVAKHRAARRQTRLAYAGVGQHLVPQVEKLRPFQSRGDARERRRAQHVEGMEVIDGIADGRIENALRFAELPHHLGQ